MGPASNEPDERFSDRYVALSAEAAIEAELEVLGTDYRANGYSTRAQVDEIGDRLDLRTGERLLDLGSGCGYPGLYLAQRHGCGVATVDPVASGVAAGAARAHRDGLDDRHLAVIGAGAALPFRPGSFDAIVHVDVMCWIRAKLSVLRACRRVLRPGGRMLFTTIEPAPQLARSDRRRVADAGPSAVLIRTGYASLLTTAGFTSIEQRDVTGEYHATQQAWLGAMRKRAAAIAAAMGEAAFEERIADRSSALAAIEDGLLRRTEYFARRAANGDVSP